MKLKKMKKLALSKETVSNLSGRKMDEIQGGKVIANPTFVRPDGKSCRIPCDGQTDTCVTDTCPEPTTDPTIGPDACGFCGTL